MANEPLVDYGRYARWTGDTTSNTTDVTAAMVDAEAAVNEACNRTFRYGTYTETLYVYTNGIVYPSVTPLEAVTSDNQTVIQGAGIWVGWFDPSPILSDYWGGRGGFPPQATITYTGGYQPVGTTDGATDPLPLAVARAIAQITWTALHPVTLPGVPANANSVHTGDVGYSAQGPLTAADLIPDTVAASLAPYRKRRVHGWQNAPKPA